MIVRDCVSKCSSSVFRFCGLLNGKIDERMTKRLKKTTNSHSTMLLISFSIYFSLNSAFKAQTGSYFPWKCCIISSSLTEIPDRVKEIPFWATSSFSPWINWVYTSSDIHYSWSYLYWSFLVCPAVFMSLGSRLTVFCRGDSADRNPASAGR